LIFDKDTDSDGDCTDDPGTGSDRYFYCRQANYNVVALTDDAGAVVEKIKYDPYGQATVWLPGDDGDWGTDDDVFQSVSSVANPYLFQGRRWDSDSDLYYFRNRSYSPVLGRFMQRDPTGYGDGMNLYELQTGKPSSHVDPLGNDTQSTGDDKCCCCCVNSIRVENIRELPENSQKYPNKPSIGEVWSKRTKAATRYGHGFDVVIDLEYRKSDRDTDCTLEWWEMAEGDARPGERPGKFYESYSRYPRSPTFIPWRLRRRPCEGKESCRITDMPGYIVGGVARMGEIVYDSNVTGKRNLYIWVEVKSAPNCDCLNESMHVYIVQENLALRAGLPVSRDVLLVNPVPPGMPPSPDDKPGPVQLTP